MSLDLTDLSEESTLQAVLSVLQGTISITDDGSFQLAANDGTHIGNVGIEDISAVTGQASKAESLPVTLASDEDTVATEQQTPVGIEDPSGTQIEPATNPAIKGGASLQSIVDAVEQSSLAEINQFGGATLQDIQDALVDVGLALAVDHPSETRVGLDVSSGVTIGPLQVQRAAEIAVAANPTSGGDVSVTVDYVDEDGNLFVSDSPISNASSAQSATVARHGTHVRIDLSGTDTAVNFHLDTHQ